MDKKKRQVCLRLAYEIPVAIFLGVSLAYEVGYYYRKTDPPPPWPWLEPAAWVFMILCLLASVVLLFVGKAHILHAIWFPLLMFVFYNVMVAGMYNW